MYVYFLGKKSLLCLQGGKTDSVIFHVIDDGTVRKVPTYLPKLQVAAGQLEGPSAHVASPPSQENAARVGRVRHQHSDTHPWTF